MSILDLNITCENMLTENYSIQNLSQLFSFIFVLNAFKGFKVMKNVKILKFEGHWSKS